MNCTNQKCGQAIPDDSAFCDQCGFPQEAGSHAKPEPARPAQEPPRRPDAASAFAQRPAQAMDSQKLRLALGDGSQVELASGDILGTAEGPLAAAWGQANLVNARHGRVESFEGRWTYTDLFSGNGSTLNDHFVRPGKPVALQPGDRLVLGNKSCTVL